MTELMVAVERVVRPVRAGGSHKDKMREELLAHLNAAYEQERAALGDDRLALYRAASRFGDPAALTRELQASVSRMGRLDGAFERWCGQRTGESAPRFFGRAAGLLFLLMAGILCLTAVAGYGPVGVHRWYRFGLGVAMTAVACASLVPLGLIYYRVRGAVCGGPGVARSPVRAVLWAGLAGLTTALTGFAFCLLGGVDPADGVGLIFLSLPAGALIGLMFVGLAWIDGPREIRRAQWECLTVTD